jgi:hypothetical protein
MQNSKAVCGPFQNNVSMKTCIEKAIQSYYGVLYTYSIFTYYPYLWLTGIILLAIMLHRRNYAAILKSFIITNDIVRADIE